MRSKIEKLQDLFAQGKLDEAKALLKEIFDEKLSLEERGALLVSYANTYIELMNSINATHRDLLKETLESMKMVDDMESKAKDRIRVEEIKESLKKQ